MVDPALLQMTPAEHIANSINFVWVLVVCFLIFFMQPGFALLEAGQVRAKNSANVVMKNMMDWGLGVLVWFLLGATIATIAGVLTTGGLGFGDVTLFSNFAAPGESSASWINWLFGAVFAMTAATIVSGAIGGRMKFSAYVLFIVAMVGVIYPVMPGLAWGGTGLLSSNGFLGEALGVGYKDFAGATIVHGVGGIAGLTAAAMVGARSDRFDDAGNPTPIPGHSMLLAVLGTLILAFGWFGFNVGTQATALGFVEGAGPNPTLEDFVFKGGALGRVAVNTTLAMGAGTVASTLVTAYWEGKPDPLFAANGLLAGLVAITGACAHVTWWGGIVIGLIGGAQTPIVYRWVVENLQIDDVCGVFAVHGSAGFIGTMLIPFFDVAGFSVNQLIMQVLGTVIVGTWGVLMTMLALGIIGAIVGLRVDEEEEEEGLDQSEHGVAAYPEFTIESGGDAVMPDGGVHTGERGGDGSDDDGGVA